MTSAHENATLDDVLDDFASEPAHDAATLRAYLDRYPEHALAILDLSHELRLQSETARQPLAEADEVWLEASWQAFAGEVFPNLALAESTDPFAVLAPGQLADVRRAMEIPSAVLAAFRDRCVLASTVPRAFLRRLANQLGASLDQLMAHLEAPPRLAAGVSYKADAGPQAVQEKMTFEAVLEDALVPPDRRKVLLEEGD